MDTKKEVFPQIVQSGIAIAILGVVSGILASCSSSPPVNNVVNNSTDRSSISVAVLDRDGMTRQLEQVLRSLGVNFFPNDLVAGLSIAKQQLLRIARALKDNSRILVRDEPTAALRDRETDRLFAAIDKLPAMRWQILTFGWPTWKSDRWIYGRANYCCT